MIRLLVLLFLGSTTLLAQPALQWARAIGLTNHNTSAISLDSDLNGNVYMTGTFGGIIDFDPGPATYTMGDYQSGYNQYISKFSPSGSFMWARLIGGKKNEYAHDLVCDAAGNVYCSGNFEDTVDLDPGSASFVVTGQGMYVLKFNAAGNLQWASACKGNKPYSSDLYIDSGNITVASNATGTLNLDPGISNFSVLVQGMFLWEMDSNGKFMRGKSTGWGGKFARDPGGNFYVVSSFSGQLDFNYDAGTWMLESPPDGQNSVSLYRIKSNWDFDWAQQYGEHGNPDAHAIACDDKGNVYFTGKYYGTMDVETGPGIKLLNDTTGVFLIKLTAQGNLDLAKSYRIRIPDDDLHLYNLQINKQGDILIAGDYRGKVSLNQGAPTVIVNTPYNSSFFMKTDPQAKIICLAVFDDPDYASIIDFNSDLNNDVLITGAFTGTIDLDPGTGKVELKHQAAGYSAFVSKFTGCPSVTGMSGNEKKEKVAVFPNPSAGKITLTGDDILNVRAFNLFGEEVRCNYSAATRIVELQDRGVLFLQVSTISGDQISKVVVDN